MQQSPAVTALASGGPAKQARKRVNHICRPVLFYETSNKCYHSKIHHFNGPGAHLPVSSRNRCGSPGSKAVFAIPPLPGPGLASRIREGPARETAAVTQRRFFPQGRAVPQVPPPEFGSRNAAVRKGSAQNVPSVKIQASWDFPHTPCNCADRQGRTCEVRKLPGRYTTTDRHTAMWNCPKPHGIAGAYRQCAGETRTMRPPIK